MAFDDEIEYYIKHVPSDDGFTELNGLDLSKSFFRLDSYI